MPCCRPSADRPAQLAHSSLSVSGSRLRYDASSPRERPPGSAAAGVLRCAPACPRSTQDPNAPAPSARPKRARSSRSLSGGRLPAARAAEPSFAIIRKSHEQRTGLATFSAAWRWTRAWCSGSAATNRRRDIGGWLEPRHLRNRWVRKPPAHPVACGPIGMLTFVKFPLSDLRKDPHVRRSRLPSGTRRNGGSAPAPGHAPGPRREGSRLCSATSGPITLRAMRLGGRSFSHCGCQA